MRSSVVVDRRGRVPVTVTAAPASAKAVAIGVADPAGAAGDQHLGLGEVEADLVRHVALQPVDGSGRARPVSQKFELASSSERGRLGGHAPSVGVAGVRGQHEVGQMERGDRLARGEARSRAAVDQGVGAGRGHEVGRDRSRRDTS